jgi:hypothetical protein
MVIFPSTALPRVAPRTGPCKAAALGEVKHVVSPNFEHVKHAAQWKESFPAATLYGCPAGCYSRSLFHLYLSRFIPDATWKTI